MLGWRSRPLCKQQQAFLSTVGGGWYFLLLVALPAILCPSALVQKMQIRIATENSLNLRKIMSFMCTQKKKEKSQEQKIVSKPSCGLSFIQYVKLGNVLAAETEHPHPNKA